MGAGSYPSSPASHPAPYLWPGKVVEDSTNPSTHVGDLEEAPGSWPRIGSTPAVVATWGVNHQMEDLPLCLLLSVYLSL